MREVITARFLLVREVTLVGVVAQGCVSGLRSVVKPGCVRSEVHLADLGSVPTCRWRPQDLMTHYRASCFISKQYSIDSKLYKTRFHTCELQMQR